MFDFVRTQTGEKDVVVFFKPRVMSLYTKRLSCLVNDRVEKIWEEGDYLVLHNQMGDYDQIGDLCNNPPVWLEKKLYNHRFSVYKILK